MIDEPEVRRIVREELTLAGITPKPEPKPETAGSILPYPHNRVPFHEWQNTDLHDYIGKTACRYMWHDWGAVAEYCMAEVDKSFPGRPKLTITDCCSYAPEGCAGHNSTHGPVQMRTLDGAYYTLRDVGGAIYKIWADTKHTVLDTSVFDWERQHLLWMLFAKHSVKPNIMTVPVIYDYILSMVREHYGSEAAQLFFKVGTP